MFKLISMEDHSKVLKTWGDGSVDIVKDFTLASITTYDSGVMPNPKSLRQQRVDFKIYPRVNNHS